MPIQKTSHTFSALETRVIKTVREHGMIHSGDLVLVALSGGADSVALLLCLHALRRILGCNLAVAHLNHCMRGEEGDGDEAFARRMSEDMGLPFVSEIVDVKKQATASRKNLEQAAREIRYEFLRRTAGKMSADRVAVGHTRNDQTETALFRFIRGSGMEGLSAIHPVVDGYLIRPLLDCTRAHILEYLKQRKRTYRDDSSNEDMKFSRNRIRHELVPYLEKHFNPGLVRTIAREASLMRENWDFIQSHAEQAFNRISRPVEEGIALNISAVEELHPALRREVVRCALKYCRGDLKNICWKHIESILFLCLYAQSGDSIEFAQNTRATRQFNTLVLSQGILDPLTDYRYTLTIPGKCYVTEAHAEFRTEICSEIQVDTEKEYSSAVFLDYSMLSAPLIIRNRIPGDRYGGGGHRKVKKMLIDRKIPLSQRHSLPVVVSDGNVIWIPGFEPAKAYAVNNLTKTFVKLEIRDNTD